ncbi:MAG: CehA/McbA family metallohydrolase [Bacteroidales bacterium]
MIKLTTISGIIFLSIISTCLMNNSVYGQVSDNKNEWVVQIDGAEHFQKVDGFGVNINAAWWLNGEYKNNDIVKPAIDMLCDQLGATIFRAVIEDADWEKTNDNNDPDVFNWNYYDSIFTSPRFSGVWNTLRYLNQKGITNNLIISFMGIPPAAAPLEKPDPEKSWMGDTTHTINPHFEDEFVESMAALLIYAKQKARIQFTLVSPMNETDMITNGKGKDHPNGIIEGPNIPDPVQFSRILHKLANKLDLSGLGDIRFVAPDAAGEALFSKCLDEIVKDTVIMNKLAFWGVHDYGNDAENYDRIIAKPSNNNKFYWVTETAGIENLFGQLDDHPSAFIFWDGFDCVYQHARRNGYGSIPPNDWCFWIGEKGKPLIEFNEKEKNWIPRKQFYEFGQIFKFIKPGAIRIATKHQNSGLIIHSFINPDGNPVIVGINKGSIPVTLNGKLNNLSKVKTFDLFFTDSLRNLFETNNIVVTNNSFSTSVPAHSVFTLAGKSERIKPEPSGWYAGDMHVHRDCGGPEDGILPESKFIEMMEVNDLAVISVLADMGDAEVKPGKTDLLKVNVNDYPLSVTGKTIHYDAEWHWDPFGTTFEHKALGGHVVLLGLKEAHQIWDESPCKILGYGRKQGGIVGFCHTEYLNDQIQNNLNCCIPIEYPVEAALGTIDFLAEDVYGTASHNYGNYNADATILAYYKLLNCGFRLGLAAGTDYPCNEAEPFGTLLTYVQVKEPFTYRKWVEGIRDGKTVIARNGHEEFIDLKVNGQTPGADIQFKNKGTTTVEVTWTSIKPLTGSLELVCNGEVIAKKEGTAKPGEPVVLKTIKEFTSSSWLCARRMDSNGHQTHTAPVYITVNKKPIRASAEDARFFVKWIDNLIEKTAPGNEWNQYFTHDLNTVRKRYQKAKEIYLKIATEALKNE